jgi:hypothetical protein
MNLGHQAHAAAPLVDDGWLVAGDTLELEAFE